MNLYKHYQLPQVLKNAVWNTGRLKLVTVHLVISMFCFFSKKGMWSLVGNCSNCKENVLPEWAPEQCALGDHALSSRVGQDDF